MKQLKIFEKGEGTPVIFLHGFISTHRYWNDILDLLPDDEIGAITPDLLGFGDSPKPRGADYSIDEQIEWLERSIPGFATQKYYLVGHSMGASIALHWLNKRPQRFKGAILSGLPVIDEGRFVQQVIGIANKPILAAHKITARIAYAIATLISYLPDGITPPFMREWPKHIAQDVTKHKAYTRKKIVAQRLLAGLTLQELQLVRVPTTLLVGKEDSLVADHAVLRGVVRANASLKQRVVSGGHQIPLRHTKLFAQEILGIIRPR